MGVDEEGTLARLKALRAGLVDPSIAERGGRIFKTTGDGVLAEFPSVVDAVQCAAKIQTAMASRSASEPPDRRIVLRVGINLGDIIVEDDDIYGDGVNIAARIEGICTPGGIAISASAYEQVRDKVALDFVDRGKHSVKNIARPVHVYALDLGNSGAIPASSSRRFALPMRRRWWLGAAAAIAAVAVLGVLASPEYAKKMRDLLAGPFAAKEAAAAAATIAVLPFSNQSGDAQRDYFSDGVTEDIINALGRFSGIRVIAHNAVQAYKGRKVSAEEINRELRVRYLVQGSVRQADGRLRVSVELSDATKGTLQWSDRYEGEGREVFEIQDRIVKNIVGALAVKLTSLEQQRVFAKPTESLEAYDLVLRARGLLAREERSANREARGLLARVLQLAPDYAEAHVANAEAEFQRAIYGWMENVEDGLRRSEESANRALAIDDPGANARAHAVLGSVNTFTGNFEKALAETGRAIELNGSDSSAYALRGESLLWTGRIQEAIAAIETARRFDPRSRASVGFTLAFAYYLAGRYQESVAVTDTFLAQNPDQVFVQAVRAAALAQLGDADRVKQAVAQVRRLDPFFNVERFGARLVNPAHRAKIQEGVRKAGL